jgi:chemotaxis protein methyltransferase CheR
MLDIDINDLKRISELIYQRHHYDFRNYAMSSFKRRVLRIMELKKLSVESLIKKLTDNPAFINEFLDELTVNVTEMFRDSCLTRSNLKYGMLAVHLEKKFYPCALC